MTNGYELFVLDSQYSSIGTEAPKYVGNIGIYTLVMITSAREG